MSNKTFKELRSESSVPANVAGSGKFAGLPPDDPVVRLKKKKKKDSVDEGPKFNPKDPMLPIEKEAISDFYKEIYGFRPRGSSFWKNIKCHFKIIFNIYTKLIRGKIFDVANACDNFKFTF